MEENVTKDTKRVVESAQSSSSSETPMIDASFKLNALSLARNNIVLYNSTDNGLFSLLKMTLSKISRLNSIDDYSTRILTDNACIRRFNEVFIDNPDLYFTEFVTTKETDNRKQVEITSKYKEVDGNLIFTTTNSRVARDIYTDLIARGKPVVLLYKRDSCVTFQSKFYTNVLSKILQFKKEKFLHMLNDENEGYDIVAIHDSIVHFF